MSTSNSRRTIIDEPLDQAKKAAADALDKAREAVECLGAMAGHTVSAVGKKADDLAAAAGHEIKSTGDVIEEKGPQSGLSGRAIHALAGTLQGGGKYVEDAKFSGMGRDVVNLVKNHPLPTILICVGVGYCIGRSLRE